MHAHMSIHMSLYMCICVHAHVCTHLYTHSTHMCICVCTYTHIHMGCVCTVFGEKNVYVRFCVSGYIMLAVPPLRADLTRKQGGGQLASGGLNQIFGQIYVSCDLTIFGGRRLDGDREILMVLPLKTAIRQL